MMDGRSQGPTVRAGLMTARKQNKIEALTLFVGVLLSVCIGAFFYFRTDLNAALATIGGLVGTTITLQVEALLLGRRAAAEATRQQRLVSRVEAVPWLPDLPDQSLTAVHAIEHTYAGTMAVDLGRKAFEECLAQLRNLQRGQFDAPFDDNWLVYALTERAQRRLLATSVEDVDLAWWQSAAGQTYWRLHEEALSRGVNIQRIFIYRTWTGDHETLARKQQAGGVRVLRVCQDQLPPGLRVDMILWDDQCGYESRVNSTGEAISNNYTFAKHDLARMTDRYKMIESCAQPWTPTKQDEAHA
jgi:hypothetical protein